MKRLLEISSEERNRILEMHQNATKKNYLILETDPKQGQPGAVTTINGVNYKLQGLTDKNINDFLVTKNFKLNITSLFDPNYTKVEFTQNGEDWYNFNDTCYDQMNTLATEKDGVIPTENSCKIAKMIKLYMKDMAQQKTSANEFIPFNDWLKSETKLAGLARNLQASYQNNMVNEKKLNINNPKQRGWDQWSPGGYPSAKFSEMATNFAKGKASMINRNLKK